jgi:hypothetical protein
MFKLVIKTLINDNMFINKEIYITIFAFNPELNVFTPLSQPSRFTIVHQTNACLSNMQIDNLFKLFNWTNFAFNNINYYNNIIFVIKVNDVIINKSIMNNCSTKTQIIKKTLINNLFLY